MDLYEIEYLFQDELEEKDHRCSNLVDDDSHWYLDLFMPLDDTCIVDNPTDAIETFKALMNDKEFVKDLKLALKEEGSTM